MVESPPVRSQYEELSNLYLEGDEGDQLPLSNVVQIYLHKEELDPGDIKDRGMQIGTLLCGNPCGLLHLPNDDR